MVRPALQLINQVRTLHLYAVLLSIAFDSHHTLIEKNPAGVKEDTRKVLETMMPGGGFIAGASHDTILEETSVDNVLAMFDEIYEYGVYP